MLALRAQLDRVRRHVEERLDQAWSIARHRLGPRPLSVPFEGEPRFAVVTVNYSTTRYLKLMLATLGEQTERARIVRIVVVDNGSRDGGIGFERALASRVGRVSLVENRHWLSHARGVRSGLRRLDALERSLPEHRRANVVVFVDTDVVFRDPTTLACVADRLKAPKVAAAGELRRGVYPHPEAQASFLVVRRDCLARPDVAPWVNHGAPAYWLQRSLWRAGLVIADFPSNAGGFVLHRGRSGVAAAARYRPRAAYASVPDVAPHYMGVADGAAIWAAVERQWSALVDDDGRALEHLALRFGSSPLVESTGA